MRNSFRRGLFGWTVHVVFIVAACLFVTQNVHGISSPYATVQTNVPLSQATSDNINGLLPYFNSHTPLEGNIASISDATSTSAPDANVIIGPDNTWVGVAWDFGDPGVGYMWRLDRIDVWIAAGDNLRKGIQADFSVSNSGNVDEFTVIPNSKHWDALSQNEQFNHVRYDFPPTFIAGAEASSDRYPVKNFRYLRLNSRGDSINGVDWQSRFVEVDAFATKIPTPSDPPVIYSVRRSNTNDIVIDWAAFSGRTYNVEYKTNLNQAEWINFTTVVADADMESVTNAAPAGSQRFYRLVLEP